MGLQKQISSLDDNVLSRAMSSGSEQVPHLMLMMEMARRARMRDQPQYPARRLSIAEEMRTGQYNPVPTPPFKWPELPGTTAPGQAMPGQSIMQQPQNLQLDQPAGLGSLFSQTR